MKRDNKLTTSGLIVAIAFGAGISAALIAWLIVSMRARSRSKHNEQVKKMMEGKPRSRSDVEGISSFAGEGRRNPAMSSEANLPLITPGGTRSDQTHYGQQEGYFQQQGSGGNSLTPPGQQPGAPRIHQGIGGLGQEQRY